jgi:hypothetical protein
MFAHQPRGRVNRRRSTGTNFRPRTRAKSRNSDSSRLNRSLPHDQLRKITIIFVPVGRSRQLLHRAPDRGEGIADLMGERRRERCHRLESFSAQIELVEPLEVRNVGKDRGHRWPPVRIALKSGG